MKANNETLPGVSPVGLAVVLAVAAVTYLVGGFDGFFGYGPNSYLEDGKAAAAAAAAGSGGAARSGPRQTPPR